MRKVTSDIGKNRLFAEEAVYEPHPPTNRSLESAGQRIKLDDSELEYFLKVRCRTRRFLDITTCMLFAHEKFKQVDLLYQVQRGEPMRYLTYLFFALLAAATFQSAIADDVMVIRFSHVVAPESPKGQAAEKFAQLVAQRSAGKVRVDLFPNSRMYADNEEISALQVGSVEMLAPSLTKLKVLSAPEFEVFDLPYLFPSIEAAHRVTQGPIGKSMLAKLENHGVIGLAIWDNGFKQMSANRPLRTPADFAGLSLRIQPSRILDAQMKALGAKSRVLQFNEVYGALKTGMVDGTEGPVSNFYTQHMHTAQRYLTLSNHGYLGYAVVTNKKFWSGLTPEIRSMLEGALKDATAFANESAQRNNDAALESVRKSGLTQIIALSPAENQAWHDALVKVHHQAEGRIPKELIDSILRETGNMTTTVSKQ
jgi:C4-dicarboxylate-binding protein DctP